MYEYAAKVERVVDGDTVDLEIDLGLKILTRQRIRLFGVNAPEVRGGEKDAGLAALARVAELTTGDLLIHTIKDRTEKYGRYLAEITLSDGSDLAATLVSEGHAVPASY